MVRRLSAAAALCVVGCSQARSTPPRQPAGRAALAGLPPRADVLAALRLANDHFAAKWPDPEVYGPVLAKAWHGLTDFALRNDGFVGRVQSTGSNPCSGPGPLGADVAPNFEDLGVGCFLLAGSEVARLSL